MSLEKVKAYLAKYHFEDRIEQFGDSTATVDEAAAVLKVHPDQIAKTLAFQLKENPIVIVAEGSARVSNQKFKAFFHQRPKMVHHDDLPEVIGHEAGAVTQFALKDNVQVFFDETLKKHDILFPSAGSVDAAIRLSLSELEKLAKPVAWVDVAKEPEQ